MVRRPAAGARHDSTGHKARRIEFGADECAIEQNPEITFEQGSDVTASLSPSRRNLLIALESIIGNEFYNPKIQNYGPGGVRESDGRAIRYPLTLQKANGETEKIRGFPITEVIGDEVLLSGHYKVGANQLDVMRALDQILSYLEAKHGLEIEKDAGRRKGEEELPAIRHDELG